MNASVLGSFDPVTNGHIDLIKRALSMFDSVIVGIGINETKKSLFSVNTRILFIQHALKNVLNENDFNRVKVTFFSGPAVDFMLFNNIQVNVRGIRNNLDYEYELPMAQINKSIASIDTIFIPCDPMNSTTSSTNVKTMVMNGFDVSNYVPLEVKANLEAALLGLIFVGVVGRSGSGKTHYINTQFSSRHVIDCDDIVKNIWDSESFISIRKLILEKFLLHDIQVKINDSEKIDKNKLRMYLNDADKNKIICEIMKPYILALIRNKILMKSLNQKVNKIEQSFDFSFFDKNSDIMKLIDTYKNASVIAVDAPMLFEYNMLGFVNNMIINITTDLDVCKKRIILRDHLTNADANSRLMMQLTPIEIKKQWEFFNKKDNFGSYAEYK